MITPIRLFFSLLLPALMLPLHARELSEEGKQEALKVIRRFSGEQLPAKVNLQSIPQESGRDVFETSYSDGALEIKGSSPVALCRGFYDFVKSNRAGICSWSGNRFQWPASLKSASPKRIVSPFRDHYYFNVVTYGYSIPYWDWNRWEKELDWMALHGVDMPLALVANEAISARVWKKMGLTDEEISSYFVGPAHLPWMRMGNISGIDGPLPAEWHKNQVALQHKILQRMKTLGMKPICPGFAGFVPPAMKRVHPEINLVETKWGGAFKNWMISPDQELFSTLGKMFIEEWEKEFGKNEYYLIDSFNEMEIPFPPKGTEKRYELLASYGEKVYGAIKAANPDATWVMQGWMFGYQRNIWDQDTLKALVSKVPDDKMMLLDMAADYNKNVWHNGMNWDLYNGFFGKEWVYSVIPNMGGKSAPTGVLEFYANGHLEALNSSKKGNLTGFGTAPEGIENNEVIYELISDAGWNGQRIDLTQWLTEYCSTRYGKNVPELQKTWDGLRKSVYGTFDPHPRFNWQFRPGRVQKGSINTNDDFYAAIENMALLAPQLKDSSLFRYDFIEMTVSYVGGKLEILANNIDNALLYGYNKDTEKKISEFLTLLSGIDKALVSHPTLRLERWLDFATKSGDSGALKKYYEKNARRIVTIWGPPVDDYSARIWSGLIRDYYLPRWQHYFEMKKTGTPFDFGQWEREWVENKTGLSPAVPYPDPIASCIKLIDRAKKISPDTGLSSKNSESLGTWTPADVSTEWKEATWNLPASLLPRLKGVLFTYAKGNNQLEISEVSLELDGAIVHTEKHHGVTGTSSRNNFYPLTVPKNAQANNSCLIRAKIKSDGKANSYGAVSLILSEK